MPVAPTKPGSSLQDLAKFSHFITAGVPFGSMTVFHFESPRSSDLGRGLEEAPLVAAACLISQHRFVPFHPRNLKDFKDNLRYIFGTWEETVDPKAERPAIQKFKPQFVIHFSGHGNDTGISIGGEFVSWKTFGSCICEAAAKTKFRFVLTLSACGGTTQSNLSEMFTKSDAPAHRSVRPVYIFSFDGSVAWKDASLTWAILYNKITDIKVNDTKDMTRLMKAICALSIGGLRYHRWNGDTYIYFKPVAPTAT